MSKYFELLAPVGGMEHLRAAVEAGADAVYLGGRLFNARINANNFDGEEMLQAVDYAHQRGVKVFVTMNTLLRDEDLEAAVSYAGELYEIGVDALIIQDWGLARQVHQKMPDFPIHLSTQGTVYNKAGVLAAQKMGFERVVLARELTMGEIAECCGTEAERAGGFPEIEVFIHGALCVCYSGQCNMSRLNGGRSGNQGLCAQPCRLKYTSQTGETQHFLSPKDSCALDHLHEMMNAGVKSFKIEGRMKSPEYVATVVGIYRKYIDLICAGSCHRYYEAPIIDEADRRALLQAFNRGSFTDGYLAGHVGSKMMAVDVPKNLGVKIGHAVKRVYQGLVEIELDDGAEINMGDGVEIHNREMSGNVVTYIKPAKGEQTGRNRRLVIGDIAGFIKGGEAVYKITDRAQNEAAQSLFKLGGDGNDVGGRRMNVALSVNLPLGKPASISVAPLLEFGLNGQEPENSVTLDQQFEDIVPEMANNRPLDNGRITEQLSKCGDYPFRVVCVDIHKDEGIIVPVSALNRMRKWAFEAARDYVTGYYRRTLKSAADCGTSDESNNEIGAGSEYGLKLRALEKVTYAYRLGQAGDERVNSQNGLVLSEGIRGCLGRAWDKNGLETKSEPVKTGNSDENRKLVLIPIEELLGTAASESDIASCKKKMGEMLENIRRVNNADVAVYVNRVSKGALDQWMDYQLEHNAEVFNLVVKLSGYPLFVGNVSWLDRLAEAGIPVVADYGMNVCNEASLMAMYDMGACGAVEALEYRSDAMGMQPMMITEQPLRGLESLQSARREKEGLRPMLVTQTALGDKTYILGI